MNSPVYYVVKNITTKKFVGHVSRSGRITACTNPFGANFFVERIFAEHWMKEKKLDPETFTIVAFTQADEKH